LANTAHSLFGGRITGFRGHAASGNLAKAAFFRTSAVSPCLLNAG